MSNETLYKLCKHFDGDKYGYETEHNHDEHAGLIGNLQEIATRLGGQSESECFFTSDDDTLCANDSKVCGCGYYSVEPVEVA